MIQSDRESGKGRIRASIEKWQNQCEYRKIVESGRVPGKGRISACTEKLSGRVLKNGKISVRTRKWYISLSTRKWYNPGEYREMVESVPMRVPKKCSDEY